MQLRRLAGVLITEGPAPVDQDPLHRQMRIVDHRPQPAHPGADQSDRVGVGSVGLAALPGREHPRPSRQLRRHVHHLLTIDE
jgi:hypothetical protein